MITEKWDSDVDFAEQLESFNAAVIVDHGKAAKTLWVSPENPGFNAAVIVDHGKGWMSRWMLSKVGMLQCGRDR